MKVDWKLNGIPLLVMSIAPVPAFAYLDPTTGSMVISAIVGILASVVLALKTYWHRFRSFFRRGDKDLDSTPEDPGA